MEIKWLTKQNSWFVRLTTIIALMIMLIYTASPGFAESEELHGQGSVDFFGKYEEPKPSPKSDPKPDPKPDPRNLSDDINNVNTPQTSEKDEPAKRSNQLSQFPKTGTVIRNLTLPGVLLIGIAVLLYIIKKRKKDRKS